MSLGADTYPGELTQEGLTAYSDDELLSSLLIEDVQTLHDIELLYGGLFNLATSVGNPETARYLTPSAANEWFNDSGRVMILQFDLADESDPYKGVQTMMYGPELVAKLTHARYAASGVAKDHSITHMFKGNADPGEMAVDRLTDWAADDNVQSVVEDEATDDAWIISRLAELGESADIRDAIESDVDTHFSLSDGGLVTVQVKLEGDDEWRWPSEVDAFTEGMKRIQQKRMASKNLGNNRSAGEGICFGTGEMTTVFGTTDDHLEMYKTRQFEKFPGIRAERAWTSHPISLDAALDESASEVFIEACQVRAFQGTIYHLPYFPGEVTADRVRDLFYTLVELVRLDEEEDFSNALTSQALNDIGKDHEDDLRFYTLLIQKPQSSPWRTLGEMQNQTSFPAADIADAHNELLMNAWFVQDSSVRFNTFDSSFFSQSGTLDSIASGQYLTETLPDRERHKQMSNKDIRPDDPRVKAFNALLQNEPLDFETLISWYVERLCYVERGDVDENSDDAFFREDSTGTEFPRWRVRRQFLQLCTLANAGFIRTKQGVEPPTLSDSDQWDSTGFDLSDTLPDINDDGGQYELTSFMDDSDDNTPDTETDSTTDDSDFNVDDRRERLNAFINDHAPLNTDDEKKSSFLLGVLVGQLGGVQSRSVENTVVDSHPIMSISKNNLHRVTTDVLHRNNIYAKKADTNSDRMYAEVTEPLTDAILNGDPQDWNLTTEMVQFYYGLGVEWGKTHRGTSAPEADENDATEPEATPE